MSKNITYSHTLSVWFIKFAALMRYTAIIYWAIFAACSANSGKKEASIPSKTLVGNISGVAYEVSYTGDSIDYQTRIDSILKTIHTTFSITVDGSLTDRINAFNRRDTMFCFNDSLGLFAGIYDPVRDAWRKTSGYLDPTLRPLMRAWIGIKAGLNSAEPDLDSLYQFVGFDESNFDVLEQFDSLDVYRETQIRKSDARTEIDFGKMLFAYALDHVAYFLSERGVNDFSIRLGNNYLSSENSSDSLSFINLQLPDTIVSDDIDISGRAFAFKTNLDKAGLMDATYGYPVENNIEYVGVIAPTALQAEAYATAFLSMGLEEVTKFYTNYPDEQVEALIIYREGEVLQSASTGGFDQRVLTIPSDEEVAE